jgi:hypothetical protein
VGEEGIEVGEREPRRMEPVCKWGAPREVDSLLVSLGCWVARLEVTCRSSTANGKDKFSYNSAIPASELTYDLETLATLVKTFVVDDRGSGVFKVCAGPTRRSTSGKFRSISNVLHVTIQCSFSRHETTSYPDSEHGNQIALRH